MRCPYLLCFVFILCSIGVGLSGTGIAHAQDVPIDWQRTLLDLVDKYGPQFLDRYTTGPKQPAASSSSSASASSSSPPPTKDEDPPSSSRSPPPTRDEDPPSSSSSGPSCTAACRDPSTEAPWNHSELYSCADLGSSAPTGAYEFPLSPQSRSAHRKSVLLYCKQGKTAVFNPSDEVPQYELRPPYKKLKDTRLPPHIQGLFFEFQGDCLNTRSNVGCANHSPPWGVTTIRGTNFYMLRYQRCQSCATSLVVRIPNDLHATEVEINAFVYSSLNFPAVLKVHGDRYDQHESVGVSACQETNRFANKEGCVCCGTNACFADTLRQPHNPSEEVTVPDNNSGQGYAFPVVRRNQPDCTPLAVDVSINGRPSSVITVVMSGKSGGHGGWCHSDQGFPAVGTGGDIYELWISKVYRPPKCTCPPAHKPHD